MRNFIFNKIETKRLKYLITLSFFTAFLYQIGFTQTSVPFTTAGTTTNNTTWICPAGVTSIVVECWGGGGAGGGATGNPAAGGGGGGGSYVKNTAFAVTPGTTYNIRVGGGGAGTTAAGAAGTDSWFSSSTTIVAKGGQGGAVATANSSTAAGALALNSGNMGSTSPFNYYGGAGGTGGASGASGGGGGSSAGGLTAAATGSNGNAAVGTVAGTAVSGGGAGVAGSTSNADGADNTNLGGGGAGARTNVNTDKAGGNGGPGKVIITYSKLTYKAALVDMTLGSTLWCQGETRDVTIRIQNTGTATWADSAAGSRDINVGLRWNTNGTYWTDYHIRQDAGAIAPGAIGTYTFSITASNNSGAGYIPNNPLAVGSNNLVFDLVYEGISWFGDNGGGVGTGNVKFTSPAQTIGVATPTAGNAGRCGPGTVTISASPGTGETIDWYDAATLGTLLQSSSTTFTTPSISGNTIYYAEARNTTTGCISAARRAVTASINVVPVITDKLLTPCTAVGFTFTPVNGTDGVVPATMTYSWSAPSAITGISGLASGSGAASFSGNLTNSTDAPIDVVYTVTPSNSAGPCAGTPFIVTVRVNPKPTISNKLLPTCSAVGFTFTPANGTDGVVPANTTYTWPTPGNVAGLTGRASGSAATSFTGTLTNTTNAPINMVYTVTPSSATGPCGGTAFTVTVRVNPNPAINNKLLPTCNATAFSFTPANGTDGIVPATTTYSWSAPSAVTGISGLAAGSGASSFSGNLTNSTNAPIDVVYSVTPSSPAGPCVGAAFTVTVRVNPRPAIANTLLPTCSAVGFTFTPVNGTDGVVPASTTYTWPTPAAVTGLTGRASGTNATSFSGTLTNSTNAPIDMIYTVTPTSPAGPCAGTAFTVTVRVNPKPAITNKILPSCSGAGFSFTPVNTTDGVVPASTTYTWSAPSAVTGISGLASGTAESSFNGNLTNSTNAPINVVYTVAPSSPAGPCGGATFTVTVRVNPTPAIADKLLPACSGTGFTFTPVNGTNGLVPVSTTYSWSAPSAVSGISGLASGSGVGSFSGSLTNSTSAAIDLTYIVTPSSAAGPCSGSTFNVVTTINPKPSITTAHTPEICSGNAFSVNLADGTDGIIPSGTKYTWTALATPSAGSVTGYSNQGTPVDLPIGQTLTNTTAADATVTYTVTPIGPDCTGSTFTIVVKVHPAPKVTAMQTTVCGATAFTVSPKDSTGNVVPAGTIYTWGDATGSGFSGGLSGSNADVISSTLTNTTNAQTSVLFSNISTAAPSGLGGCPGTSFNLTVKLRPTPFIADIPSTVCSGIPFTVTPTNGGGNIISASTSYAWANPPLGTGFGGGASGSGSAITGTLNNTTPASNTTATYTVIPTGPVSLGSCVGSSFNVAIDLKPRPTATITSASVDTICTGGVLSYAITSSVGDPYDNYKWSRPAISTINGNIGKLNQTTLGLISETLNNSSAALVDVHYSIAAMYDGCPGPFHDLTVTVKPTVSLPNQNIAACSGEQFIFGPQNASSGIIPDDSKFTWGLPTYNPANISGGFAMATKKDSLYQTLTNLTGAVQNATYTVGVSSASSCVGGSFALFVKLNPVLNVSVNSSTDQYVCSGENINPISSLTNLSALGAVLSWTRVNTANLTGMAASGGSTITGSLINNSADTLLETFTVQSMLDSCIATTTIKVYVKPTPVITGLPTSQTALCSGTSPNTTITLSSNVTNTTFNWLRDNTANITGLPASSSTVADISADLLLPAGVNTTQRTIFTITPEKAGCAGLPIKDTVFVKPIPQFTLNPTTVSPVCSSTSFGTVAINASNSVAGTSYRWDRNNTVDVTGMPNFEDNVSSISGILKNITGSNLISQFIVTATADGCSSSKTIDVEIKPQPVLAITPTTQSLCNSSPLNISLSGGNSYTWNRTGGTNISGIGTSGSGATISSAALINPSSVKDSTIFTVQTLGANGCATIDSTKVIVYATLTAPTIGDAQYLCTGSAPADINIKTEPTGGSTYTYQWYRSTTAGGTYSLISGEVNPDITPSSTTEYYYQLRVSSGACGTVTSNNIRIQVGGASRSLSLSTNIPEFVCSGETLTTRLESNVYIRPVRFSWAASSTYITPSSGTPPDSDYDLFGGGYYRSFSLTYNNSTTAQVTTNLTIYPKFYGIISGSFECDAKVEVFPIKINPKPIASVRVAATQSQTICSGTSPTAEFKSNITDFESDFTWRMTAPATITSSLGIASATDYNLTNVTRNTYTTLASLCGTLTNGNFTKQTVTFTITPKSRTCTGAPITITVYVKGKVDAGTNPQDVMICSAGDPAEFQPGPASAGVNPKYQWQRSATAGCTTGFANIAGATGEFYDEAAGLTTARYYRRVVTDTTSGVSCAVTPATCFALTINNVTGGNIIAASQTVCLGNNPAEITGGLTVPSAAGTLSYQWQIFDGTNYVDIADSTRSSLKPLVVTSSIFRRQVISTNISPASTCIANSTNVANVYVNTVTAGDIDRATKEYCGTSIPSLFTSVSPSTWNGTSHQYKWLRRTGNDCDSPFTAIGSTNSETYNLTSAISSNTLFKRASLSTLNGVTCTDTTACIKVSILNINAGQIGESQAVCLNGTPQAFISQQDAATQGDDIVYDWEYSSTGLPGDWTSLSVDDSIYKYNNPVTSSLYFRRSAFDDDINCKVYTSSVSIFVNNFTVGQVDVPSCNSLNPNAFILTDAATSSGGGLSYLWKKSDNDCSGDWSPATGINDDESYQPTNLPEGSHYYHRVVTSTLGTNSCTDTANCVLVKAYDGVIGTWRGVASPDWFDCANWGSGVLPTSTMDVIVPFAPISTRLPEIADNLTSSYAPADNIAHARSLTLQGRLTFTSAVPFLNITGNLNFDSDGVLDMTTGGTVRIIGAGTQAINTTLASTIPTFNNVTINNGDVVNLFGKARVDSMLTLTNGFVNTSLTNLLTLTPVAKTTGASINSFINGPMAKETNSTPEGSVEFTFPIGKTLPSNNYQPAGVLPVGHIGTTTYIAEFKAANPSLLGYPFVGTTLTGILSDKYWDIDRVGSGTARVVLNYQPTVATTTGTGGWVDGSGYTNSTPPPNSTNVAVAHGDGTWDFTKDDGFFEITTAPLEAIWFKNSGKVYSGEMLSFSPFSIGFGSSNLLPITLLSFEGRILGTDGALSWKIADASDLAGFELQYSTDGITFRKLADVPANGSTVYSYLDKQLPIGARYYRLLVKEKSGNSLFSKLLVLTLDGQRTSIVGLANTIVREPQVTGKIISAKSQSVRALVSDVSGRQIKEQKGHLQAGTNRWLIGTGYLAQGMYFVTIITDDGVKATLQFVKE